MYRDEFEKGISRLQEKWKNFASSSQLEIFWSKWKRLPDNTFRLAVDSALFKCVVCPSGERIQEEINLALQSNARSQVAEKPKHNGCKTCDGQGYQTAGNANGNETIFLCSSCLGRGLSFSYSLPKFDEIKSLGYSLKKSLAHDARKDSDWLEYDKSKYSKKIGAIYYTVQRALLTKDIRGINGIKRITGMSSSDLMKLYELVREGNLDNDLIKKHNNAEVSLVKSFRSENNMEIRK